MKKILLFIIIAILSACSSGENNGLYTKSMTVGDHLSRAIKSPWKMIKSEGSDLAFINGRSNSIFIFNSACRKFEVSSLPNLTNSILTGVNNVKILEKTTTTHQERAALLVVAQGSVDGIIRYFRVLTTQKNNCIYDYALISTTQAQLEKDTKDFNQFIQLLKLN